jgi:cell wall-associated NlpC family hydrolase
MIKRLLYAKIILGISFASIACGQMTAMADSRSSALHDQTRWPASLSDSLITFAQTYLKTPYRYGAEGDKAFDCSGFVGFIYRQFGYHLERTAAGQANSKGIEIKRIDLQPGDLVFFKGRNAKQRRIGHVGIVVEADESGNFKFIHASIHHGVTITESKKDYYNRRYVTAKRIPANNVPALIVEPIKVKIPILASPQ